MAEIFLTALTVGFSGAMMPGPLLTYTIKQSLSRGPASGFIITLGHALLELVLLILIFLGLNIILQSEAAQITIGISGGLMLVYMGADMIVRAVKNKLSAGADGRSGSRGMMLSGAVISAANPYFLLWWAVIGLNLVLRSYNEFGFIGVAVFFAGHMSSDFIWYGAVSVIVGTTRKFIKQTPYRVIIAALGALLVFFGGNFVYGAITNLIYKS